MKKLHERLFLSIYSNQVRFMENHNIQDLTLTRWRPNGTKPGCGFNRMPLLLSHLSWYCHPIFNSLITPFPASPSADLCGISVRPYRPTTPSPALSSYTLFRPSGTLFSASPNSLPNSSPAALIPTSPLLSWGQYGHTGLLFLVSTHAYPFINWYFVNLFSPLPFPCMLTIAVPQYGHTGLLCRRFVFTRYFTLRHLLFPPPPVLGANSVASCYCMTAGFMG